MRNRIMHFATFADGHADVKKAGIRLIKQAEDTQLFKSVNLFDLQFIEQVNSPLNKSFYFSNPRGFGYWTWKPQLLNYLMKSLTKEGELLIYSDAGSEIVNNYLSRNRFRRLVKKTEKQPILAFNTSVAEYKYTKSLCLNLLDDEKSKYSNQVAATTIIIKNCPKSREIMKLWSEIATKSTGLFSNDKLSEEIPGFIEHRCDQSIFSVLYKNSNLKPYAIKNPPYKNDPVRVNLIDKVLNNNFFFWQIRNKSGNSCVSQWQQSAILSSIIFPISLIRPIFYAACKFVNRFVYKISRVSNK